MTGATQIVYFNQTSSSIPTFNNWVLLAGIPIQYISPYANYSASGVATDSSGGAIISGGFSSYNSWVYKVSAYGQVSWSQALSLYSTSTFAYSVINDPSTSDVYIAGYNRLFYASNNWNGCLISKFNSAGTFQFANEITQNNGTFADRGNAYFYDLVLDTSSNIYAVGSVSFSFVNKSFIAKYNTSGSLITQRYYGSGGVAGATNAVAVDPSGNIYTTGYYGSAAMVSKFNASLNLQFFKTLAPSSSPNCNSNGIATDSSSNFYIFGTSATTGSGMPFTGVGNIFAKYNSSGTLQFQKYYKRSSGFTGDSQYAYDLVIDSSSTYLYALGRVSSIAYNLSTYIVKYDTSGNIIWQRSIGTTIVDSYGTPAGAAFVGETIALYGSDYYIAGYLQLNSGSIAGTQYVSMVIKLPTDGSLTGSVTLPTPNDGSYGIYYVTVYYADCSATFTSGNSTLVEATPVAGEVNYGFPASTSALTASANSPYTSFKPIP
jgi:hypothetical protein